MSQSVLHIDASASGQNSESAQLSADFVAQWKARHPADQIFRRDIVTQPLPHLDQALLGALFTPQEQRSPEQVQQAARVDELVEEFLTADVLVLGVPMYNFGIPSTLKVWVDHIAQAGRTFRYTEQGPEGLAGGKQVFILSTRGGIYEDSPLDHQVAYLRTLFGFLGIDDIQVIQAEGLNISADSKERSLSAARQEIGRLLQERQAEAA